MTKQSILVVIFAVIFGLYGLHMANAERDIYFWNYIPSIFAFAVAVGITIFELLRKK